MKRPAAPNVAYWTDASAWPLVREGMRGPISDETLDRYIDTHVAYLGRRAPFAVIFDGREAESLSATQRKRLAAFLVDHHDALARYHVAIGLATSSRIVQGLITAVYWLAPPPYPYKVFARDIDATERWVRAQLAGRCGFGLE